MRTIIITSFVICYMLQILLAFAMLANNERSLEQYQFTSKAQFIRCAFIPAYPAIKLCSKEYKALK